MGNMGPVHDGTTKEKKSAGAQGDIHVVWRAAARKKPLLARATPSGASRQARVITARLVGVVVEYVVVDTGLDAGQGLQARWRHSAW